MINLQHFGSGRGVF